MPGHVMPLSEIENRMLDAMVVGVAHAEQRVREAATFLAPHGATGDLESTIEAEPPRRTGKTVRGRVHTSSDAYYGIFQEQKDFYRHPRGGEAHFMANAALTSAQAISDEVRTAIEGVA
jgi:hypothetical protein